jgi:hypothetical protein
MTSATTAYPVLFRILPKILLGLSCQETSKRAEMFALGSLLYELMSTRKPFEELDDDEILARYSGHDLYLFLRLSLSVGIK